MTAPTGPSGFTNDLDSPATSAVRASGIAGAFGGGMPRMRPEQGVVGESQVDRPAQEVAAYPPFSPSYPANATKAANGGLDTTGGWGPAVEATGVNGQFEDAPTALFGNPLAEPPPPPDTGPPPAAARHTPAAQDVPALSVDAPTERLPIYEAVLSQWFEATDTGSHKRPADLAPPRTGNGDGADAEEAPSTNGDSAESHEVVYEEQPEPAPWVSPGDAGWEAARALLEHTEEDALTSAGLPKRVPKAHLVPGSAAPRAEDPEVPAPPPLPPRTADAVRGRMSSFQQGVRRGRHALIEAYAGDQSGSDESRQDEEQE
jgi:hypothetical protein